MIVAVLSIILFLPIYLIESMLGNYLLAGFIFVEVLLFLLSALNKAERKLRINPYSLSSTMREGLQILLLPH